MKPQDFCGEKNKSNTVPVEEEKKQETSNSSNEEIEDSEEEDSDWESVSSGEEDGEEPIHSFNNQPMRSEFQSEVYENDIFIEEEEPILDVENKKDYYLIYFEKSPESNINTRPVYRGAADENDAYTTILIAKQTEKERIGLTEELREVAMKLWKASSQLFAIASIFLPSPLHSCQKTYCPLLQIITHSYIMY